ncbi:PAS domain S-box protein [Flavitalea sp. BT771]|uniref:PAS domain-containing sensor histidine kinase n=1 Tax=Flavitalea sp. BT771 TaxID=3063329 RepID=UPI0026E16838|nr:PAS domain S-box protein [Flavitalea sp. BT771]MDO6431126.1 PAS domain S-box protein [Flavitalea sp. BT771]MDV6220033.1 PAS domain S-box protein [Flavitalea sp. BT771]
MRASRETAKKKKSALTNRETTFIPDPLLQKAFENSLQANIISLVADGRIIRANRAACRLLGYSKKELLTRKRKDIFQFSEESYKLMLRQRTQEGSAKADLSIIRKGGKLWPCEITSVVFKDAKGIRNSITSIVDRRGRLSIQKKIDVANERSIASNIVIAQSKSDTTQAENNDWIRSIGKTTYDVTWDWDIAARQISFGRSYENVFGHKLPEAKVSFEEWMAFFQKEEREMMQKKIRKVFESEKKTWEDSFQFMCPDGRISNVIIRSIIIRNSDGNAIRMIGVIHDISKTQKLEEILEWELRVKKNELTEAVVEARETERSDIGKELHDNVNQILAASMLYLDMARKDIKNGEIYLIHSSEYMFTAIEEIRKLTKGLMTDKDFRLCAEIEHIARDTMKIYPVRIRCILKPSMEKTMSSKFKLNTYRIVQEQLNNILKHAGASEIQITMSETKAGFVLSILDNGIGFDITKKKKNAGIGISNIISRAELFRGKASFITAPGNGCKLILTFPITPI